MKIKDYFKGAFRCFGKAVTLLAQGVFFGIARLFRRYPNPTWAVLMACVVAAGVVKIGEARAERDSYGKENAELQQQLDSLQGKEIRYMGYKE